MEILRHLASGGREVGRMRRAYNFIHNQDSMIAADPGERGMDFLFLSLFLF